MINITDIVQSSGYKNFMAKLYGMGATVVIVGALFKINHWPGGAAVITTGLLVEAVIFFFSSFEPLHEELDWTLVYPELAGLADPDEIENFKVKKLQEGGRSIERIEDVLGEASQATGGIDDLALGKLGDSFTKLSKTAEGLSDLTQATAASEDFIKNLQGAATSVGGLTETYSTTTESIKESTTNLTSSYFEAASKITQSGNEIAESYQSIASTIQEEQKNISLGSKEHEAQIEKLNKSLSDLNTVYESQIRETQSHMKGSTELYNGLQSMISNLKDSVDETNKYKDEMSKLKESIASLNGIYGNMLSTMDDLTK